MTKFDLRELLLLALIVAIIFVLGYLLLPFMQLMPLPAYKALIVAPLYGGGVTLLTMKIRKMGVVTLLGLLMGALLSTFFIGMFFIALIGGILTDFITLFLFKGYKNKYSIAIASGLFPALQLPVTFIIVAYTIGGASAELLKHPLVILIPTLITFLLGYITSRGLIGVLERRGL